jgi:cytochrome c-type biogenesis protein
MDLRVRFPPSDSGWTLDSSMTSKLRVFSVIVLAAGLAFGARLFLRVRPLAAAGLVQLQNIPSHPAAPDFTLTDTNGAKLSLSDYKGKVVLLDFWATWCGPCRVEIPWFVEMQQKYRDRGFVVIGVATRDSPDAVAKFYQQFHLNYPVALGNDALSAQYGGLIGLPTSFVIGRDGRIYSEHTGTTGKDVFEGEIEQLLAGQQTGGRFGLAGKKVEFGLAFLAGLVSFLSPCVLPLVPGYISMLSGTSMEELRGSTDPALARRIFVNSIAFVIGFAVVFMVLGASASAVGSFLLTRRTIFNVVAGVIIIVFGLHLTGLVRIPFLYRSAGIQTGQSQRGSAGAFLLGFAFAFGWTPCIGPILAGILTLAATHDTLFQGMMLLAVYSAGLALPFLLTSLGLSQFLRFYGRFRRHLQTVEVGSGILLIVLGVLIAFNKFTVLSGYLSFLNRFTL